MIRKLSAAVMFMLLAGTAWGKPPRVEPAKAGFDGAKLAGLRAELQKFIDKKQIAGAVAVIGRHGHLASFEVVGQRDLEAKKPLEADTVFRIASMTKVVTAVAVMLLEEDGKLSVDDPVEKHLPEFRGQKLVKSSNGDTMTLMAPERPITIKDLLTHTSGMNCNLPAGFADLYKERHRPLAEAVVGFSQHPLADPPGKVWRYCGPAYDTIGRVVEVAGGQPFEAFLRQRIFRPLGMKDTTFHPSPAQRARLAVIYGKDGESLKPAERQEFATGNVVFESASGGLFSTAPDYARFCQMLAGRGSLGDKRVMRAESVAKMASVHFSYAEKVGFTPGLGMGLGVQVVMKPLEVTASLSPGSFGHGGAFGTQAWIDPKNEAYFLLMIQRRDFGNGDMSDIRKTLQEIGAAALIQKTAAAP